MELDLHSLFGLHVTWRAQLFPLAEAPQSPPPRPLPPHLGLIKDVRCWLAKIDDISL